MKALIVDHLGGHPSLRDVADPVITHSGTSLVRVHAAVVSHLDVQIYGGDVSIVPTMPLVPGTEASGEVVAGGTFPAGTPVRVRGGGIGVKHPGAWAELVVAPDSALTVLEPPVHWGLAAAYFSPTATAWAAVHDVARLDADERLLVTGAAGAVGAMTVQLAARHGCEVVAVVGTAARRDRVPVGAAAVVAFDEWDEAGDAIGRVDAVVDTVGGAPLAAAIRRVRPGGRVALVGYTAGDRIEVPLSELLVGDVALLPTNLLRRGPALVDRGVQLLAELTAGELSLEVHRFALDDVDAALDALASRDVTGRIVLTP